MHPQDAQTVLAARIMVARFREAHGGYLHHTADEIEAWVLSPEGKAALARDFTPEGDLRPDAGSNISAQTLDIVGRALGTP
jgi:hypothetical protein